MRESFGALLIAIASIAMARTPAVLESRFAPGELALDPEPASAEWQAAPRVTMDHDMTGKPIAGVATEIRSRWTREHLYLLFICPGEALNLKSDPDPLVETPRLWNWDVAEAFIGSDFDRIGRYREFQVSPQGEWVDLDIDRAEPTRQQGMAWNSGYAVRARIDREKRMWYALMRIPFRAIDARPPVAGRELRIGLFRIAGVAPARTYYAWQPTGQSTFHVPQAFGTLRLR